jgi:mannose/cellobiose epimerase-like protein (N-acyl-D-glucosamine 2-epimerase family)
VFLKSSMLEHIRQDWDQAERIAAAAALYQEKEPIEDLVLKEMNRRTAYLRPSSPNMAI